MTIEMTWTDAQLLLSVTNAPPRAAPPHPRAAGTGSGLLGMRERAAAAGGAAAHEPTHDGGFRVTVTLPADPSPIQELP
ncbi:hypothetical protein [uncultured Cellulomonas sp.]|uniref:hypothetical protein n=1 Tax=uncultured Cellulomonas sp. TaxID=189682 RepID=UPI00345C4B27